jgi:phosphoglycolate phosphatase-like HAD superfamily hydrolase
VALALIFDLDGTLIDTVYAHVFAWQRALAEAEMPIDGWRIHRRIGMSGGLFARAVAREVGRELTDAETEEIQRRHGEIFRGLLPERRPLPGALGVQPVDCYVVGDAVWDLLAARRARMLSIGLLSGGYGADELLAAGAFRVYEDSAELHRSLDELGFE